jgi:hypothetical protein
MEDRRLHRISVSYLRHTFKVKTRGGFLEFQFGGVAEKGSGEWEEN